MAGPSPSLTLCSSLQAASRGNAQVQVQRKELKYKALELTVGSRRNSFPRKLSGRISHSVVPQRGHVQWLKGYRIRCCGTKNGDCDKEKRLVDEGSAASQKFFKLKNSAMSDRVLNRLIIALRDILVQRCKWNGNGDNKRDACSYYCSLSDSDSDCNGETDKASLLAEVIEYVKELKRHAADLAEGSPVPSEADELSVDSCTEEGRLLIRASLCCDDRPDLLSDLIKTLRTLRLRAVKAEMATLGGRVKNVFVVTNGSEEPTDSDKDNPSVTCIQDALKAVMERQNSGEFSPGTSSGNKRQRQLGQFGASLHILEDRSSF